jgi:hypothetical protein
MDCTKTWWLAAALVCAGCPGDGDDDTGAGTTDGSATVTAGPSTGGSTGADDDVGATTAGASDGSTGGGGATESTGAAEGSTGHEETEGHDAGSETGHGVCDVIGEGCHDNETKEGIACHLLGHDGDEMVCMEAFEMCAEICGL